MRWWRPPPARRAGRARPGRSASRPRPRRRQTLTGLAFAAPFLIGLAVFFAYPILASAWYSFTDFNLFQDPEFVGLDNYQTMWSDQRLRKSLWNTAYLTVLGVPLSIVIALTGAHVLNLRVRGQPIYRALVYLPTIIPIVVGGYLWRWLLNARYGFLNHVLETLHLPGPSWLEDPAWGKPAILLMSFWTVGATMVIYLAALRQVPRELPEAAALDGAGPIARFRHVTWPMLTPVTLFQVIVLIIAYLQIFTQPFVLTQSRLTSGGGGPGDSMLVYAVYLFQNAFVFLKMGYASAMAWILFLLTMAVTAVLLGTARRWVHYGS